MVWLSKEDMSILFDRDRSVISRHIMDITILQDFGIKILISRFLDMTILFNVISGFLLIIIDMYRKRDTI